MAKLIVETTQAGGIPVLTIAPEDARGLPIVFSMHGYGSSKEEMLELGVRLARRGLFFVAFDAAHHGQRADGRLESFDDPAQCVYPVASGMDRYVFMHEVVVQNAHDVATLLDSYRDDPRADVGRCGVTGASMGGFAAFYIAATEPQVRAAAPIIAVPAFAERWEDIVLEAWTYGEWRGHLEQAQTVVAEHTAFMRSIDPFERLKSFYPRPLFILCGDQDTDQPKVYSVRLLRLLLPVYGGQPARLKLKIYDGARHEVTEQMMDDVGEWFSEYL